MIKEEIKKVLEKVTGVSNLQVDFVSEEQFGDYSSNVAMTSFGNNKLQTSKTKYKTPHEYAQEIITKLLKDEVIKKFFDKIEIAGPGFINFWLKKDILIDNLIQIDGKKEKSGQSDIGKNKLVIVEYSSPNIAKPFGVGHLRSTVIGDSIANLMEAVGYKVLRDNHLGDWGTQFGKVICAIKKWGDESEIEKSKVPVEELTRLYVKFHEASKEDEKLEDEARSWFKKLEDGDLEAKRLWKKCVDWSWIEFEKIYGLLDIKFYEGFNNGKGLGESFFETRMTSVIKELEKNKLLKVGEEGAKLVFFEEDKYPPAMILKKDGATLYHTRDLATDKFRLEKYDPSLIVNEVGNEQSLYFRQLFEIEKILGWFKEGQRVHVGHGLFLMDGKKMSTRAGKTVRLEDVLDEAINRAKNLGNNDQKTAEQVGIGAIKYFDLSHHPLTNINFDWEKMFAMEGNSGPYIQYTFARTQSLISKVKKLKKSNSLINLNNEELLILRKLSQFQEIIADAAKNYSPNILCTYLYDLASKFNTFYNKHKIIGSESEEFRILLTKGTGQVLKNGLNLLGIKSPVKM